MKENILAAIDVGSSKICTLVAEVTPEDELRILGVGVTPAQGVKKGMVDNIQQATAAIANSVDRAETFKRQPHPLGARQHRRQPRAVDEQPRHRHDPRRAAPDHGRRHRPGDGRRAQVLNLPTNREMLHSVPRFFVVEGEEQVTDPVGHVRPAAGHGHATSSPAPSPPSRT